MSKRRVSGTVLILLFSSILLPAIKGVAAESDRIVRMVDAETGSSSMTLEKYSFIVNVTLEGETNYLNAYGFTVKFDNTKVSCRYVRFPESDASFVFYGKVSSPFEVIRNDEGHVGLSDFLSESDYVNVSQGILCQIEFSVIATGSSVLEIWEYPYSALFDWNGRLLSFTPENLSVTVPRFSPEASFTFTPSIPMPHETVTFDASTSLPGRTDSEVEPIVEYAWDFESDGVVDAYGVTVTHTYSSFGTCLATLNVTDSQGLWDTEERLVKVGAAAFSIVYYDNYNYKTGQWEDWENWNWSTQPHYLWNDEYLADFTSGKTEATVHYFTGITDFDLRGGFYSLDGHYTDEDWNPLRSIGDTVSGMAPHHVFAAVFTGWVYFEEGDVLTLESDDDAYVFLDSKTEWGQEILADPGIHYFGYVSATITAELAGYHLMAVKFAERCDVNSGIQIGLNGVPIRAVTPPISVHVDIKPGSWPNPINVVSEGVFAVAVCGTGSFDVTTIDPSTVEIYIEGIEEGVAPIRWSYEDVATPYTGEAGGGHALRGDGYMDLVFHFITQEVVDTLGLVVHHGKTIPLVIAGNLYMEFGGAPIRGQDYVRVLLIRHEDRLTP